MIRYALFTSVILAGLSAASCWERNENIYCDGKEWFCNDPAYPFCNGNRCEARPTDMSTVDVGPDSAPICTTSSACDPATPICDNNACRPCTGPADDAECSARSNGKPWCFNGACVSCRENAHCANTTPICGSGNVCRACTAHSECASLVCNLDGSCAPPSMVAYVDNANGTCTGAHSGTSSTDATCTIEQGIAVGRPIVRVAGSTVAYPKVAISSGTVTIVGPGQKGVSPSAKVSGDLTNPAFNISGATTTVTIDGIEVSGGGAGQDGIVCSNGTLGPTLTLRRMFIANVPGAGVSTTRCRITIERSQIGPGNTGGGIVLSSSQYSIVNNFVVANGSSNAAVSIRVRIRAPETASPPTTRGA